MQHINSTLRKLFATSLAGVILAVSAFTASTAVAYPTKPIMLVIPFNTGGYNDRLARALAPFLAEELGQPIEIMNRGGAGTIIGNTLFVNRPADGYTIMVTSVTPFIPITFIEQEPTYQLEDFYAVNLPSRDVSLVATSRNSNLNSWPDIISRLKENPRSLSIGIQPGSADYLNLVLALEAEGLSIENMRIVTYDGGGPARTAAAGGQVDFSIVGAQGFLPLLSEIKPLLVFNDEPFAGFESTQNIADYAASAGLDIDFVGGSMRGVVIHSALKVNHPDRYEILVSAIERTSKRPDVIESLKNQNLATDWFGPEVSNRAFINTSRVMQRYADILSN